jgi:membrane protein
VLGFLIWGLGIGPIVQSVYARAWGIGIEASSAVDQWLFTVWFFVVTGLIVLVAVCADQLRGSGLLLLVLVWLVGSTLFWLWTPRFLLRGRIGLRPLLPGALLSTGVIGGAMLTAPLWISSTLNAQGRAFGSFGIALAILAYAFIMITMSLVCVVFSPVWGEWRRAEKQRHETAPAATAESASP